MDESRWLIIYPRGDKTKLSIVEIVPALDYEIADYSVASRQAIYDLDEARTYAKSLAKANGLTYEGDNSDEPDYLD